MAASRVHFWPFFCLRVRGQGTLPCVVDRVSGRAGASAPLPVPCTVCRGGLCDHHSPRGALHANGHGCLACPLHGTRGAPCHSCRRLARALLAPRSSRAACCLCPHETATSHPPLTAAAPPPARAAPLRPGPASAGRPPACPPSRSVRGCPPMTPCQAWTRVRLPDSFDPPSCVAHTASGRL